MLKLKKKIGRTDEGCNNKEKQFEIYPHKFFKIILPHTLHHKILRIPETFTRDFSPQLPLFATQTVRTGLSWKLELERIDNKLYFTQGWADFMEQNAIKYGYFLEFEYQENEHFKDYIFDLSCSEIEYPREYDQYAKYHRDHDDMVIERVMVEEEEDDDIDSDCIILKSNYINPSFTAVVRNYNISSTSSYL
uniref:TF-B3 domain-containing protein n=2 Tax=Chenopodium quinoa TaxID=63459 RepID=A0A803LDZ7_CHEQI